MDAVRVTRAKRSQLASDLYRLRYSRQAWLDAISQTYERVAGDAGQ